MVDYCAKKRGVVYARANLWNDEGIEQQIKLCREKMKADGVEEVHPPITDCGSGKNFQRAGLAEVLKLAKNDSFDRLYMSDIDRIGRDAGQLLYFLLKLRSRNITIVTPSQVFDANERDNLISMVVKAFSAEKQVEIRQTRAVEFRVRAFTNRHWAFCIPLAYAKKGNWIEKSPGWEPVIDALFNLFLKHKNYGLVCSTLNSLYGSFLKKPLTQSQIKRILRNPVYMGKPKLSGAVIGKMFPETIVEDPSLRYVTEDKFAKAQKIIRARNARY